jgi:hypothetical protein
MVVSNTSPITNLAAIGQFFLLKDLFGEISIAECVWDEPHIGGRHPGSQDVEAAPWVRRQAVASQPLVLPRSRNLDRGESETLALALELAEGGGRKEAPRRRIGTGTLMFRDSVSNASALRFPRLPALSPLEPFPWDRQSRLAYAH